MSFHGINSLQKWCKFNTQGYNDVNIKNMTTSWRDGLAFCALIHNFRPDLLDFSCLSKENIFHNNKLAFDIAEKELGIPSFLDPKDMVVMKSPDRLSIITYVQQYYHYFIKTANQQPDQILLNKLDIVSVTSEADEKENFNSPEEILSKCGICKNKVHIVERVVIDGNVFHRHCHRKSSLRRLYGRENQKFLVMKHKEENLDEEKSLKKEISESNDSVFQEDFEESSLSIKDTGSKESLDVKSSCDLSSDSESATEKRSEDDSLDDQTKNKDDEKDSLNPFLDDEEDQVDSGSLPACDDERHKSLTAPLLEELPKAKARSFVTQPLQKSVKKSYNPFEDEEEEESLPVNPFGDDTEDEVDQSEMKIEKAKNPFLTDDEVEEKELKKPTSATKKKGRAPPPPPTASARREKSSTQSTVSNSAPIAAPRKKVKAPNWKDEVGRKMEEANKLNLENKKFVGPQVSKTSPKSTSANKIPRKPTVKPTRMAPAFGYPLVKREVKGSMSENDLLSQLEEVDGELKELEHRGIILENILRNTMSSGNSWKTDNDHLLKEWFEVNQEKNRLDRSAKLLMYQMQERKLEEDHAEIEFRIRKLMNKPEKDKTVEDKEEEQKLLNDLVEVVGKRDTIIKNIEEQRIKEEEEDAAFTVIKDLKRESLGSVKSNDVKAEKKSKKKKLKVKKLFGKNKKKSAQQEEKYQKTSNKKKQ